MPSKINQSEVMEKFFYTTLRQEMLQQLWHCQHPIEIRCPCTDITFEYTCIKPCHNDVMFEPNPLFTVQSVHGVHGKTWATVRHSLKKNQKEKQQ